MINRRESPVADKKKLFTEYQKSKRSLDEIIDLMKGTPDDWVPTF